MYLFVLASLHIGTILTHWLGLFDNPLVNRNGSEAETHYI